MSVRLTGAARGGFWQFNFMEWRPSSLARGLKVEAFKGAAARARNLDLMEDCTMYARLFAVAGLPLLVALLPALIVADPGSTPGGAALKPGTYKGGAKENAAGAAFEGKISLTIPRLGKDGRVTGAEVVWSDGLIGMGALSGTLDKAGNLSLKGTVVDSTSMSQWDVMLTAKVKLHVITGQYSYRGRNGEIDGDGEFRADLVDKK